MEIKKRQHYIWQEYLSNWSINDKINVYSKINKKFFTTNPINIAVENYFYEIPELNNNDITRISELINQHANSEIAKSIKNLIFKSYSLIEYLQNFKNIDEEGEKILAATKKNLVEDLCCSFEDIGKEFVKIGNSEILKNKISSTESYCNFMIFIFSQYLRTKKFKEEIILGININNYYEEKYWIFFFIIYSFELAYIISTNENVTIEIIENSSEINFISADQPILNLLHKIRNNDNYVKDLEFYYPLNSGLAIKIIRGKRYEFKIKKITQNSEVEYLNYEIFNYANDQIYFKEIRDLKNCL